MICDLLVLADGKTVKYNDSAIEARVCTPGRGGSYTEHVVAFQADLILPTAATEQQYNYCTYRTVLLLLLYCCCYYTLLH